MIIEKDNAYSVLSAFIRTQAAIRFKPDGTILEANQLFLDAMEVTEPSEIIGKHHRVFVEPVEAASADYETFWADIGAGRFQQGEFRRRTLKGNTIWISGTYTPVRDASGRVTEVVKFALDVSERKIAVDAFTDALLRLAAGDISVRLDQTVRGQFNGLRTTFNETAAELETLIRSVMGSTERLSWSGEALRGNAEALSEKTGDQAKALTATSTALKAIAAQIRATSVSAGDADDRAKEAQENATRGGEIVARTIEAIQRIEDVTREVTKITKVIEGFAFQTNVLSINAAVETARAGDAGKGFAVVASEVRSLAQRSAEASKSIGELTRRCEADVANGAELAASAGTALSQIGTSVETVVSSVMEIAAASKEQALGLSDVENSTKTLEDSLQGLSSLSSEGAQHSSLLSEQISELNKIVEHFSTRSGGVAQTLVPPAIGAERRQSTGG